MKIGTQRQACTFVGHADLTSFAHNFGDILRFFDSGRNEVLKLGVSLSDNAKSLEEKLTSEILTDCDKA